MLKLRFRVNGSSNASVTEEPLREKRYQETQKNSRFIFHSFCKNSRESFAKKRKTFQTLLEPRRIILQLFSRSIFGIKLRNSRSENSGYWDLFLAPTKSSRGVCIGARNRDNAASIIDNPTR